MAGKHFGETFGASAPENYQRFFVPAIGRPLAADLIRESAADLPGAMSLRREWNQAIYLLGQLRGALQIT